MFWTRLLPHVRGNVGFVFTKDDLTEVREILTKNKVQAPARAGGVAPCDVIIPAQNTGLGPEKTSFFQALSIPTKISKGTIEIIVSSKNFSLFTSKIVPSPSLWAIESEHGLNQSPKSGWVSSKKKFISFLQNNVNLIKEGDKVGASEATLLNMLNVSPFTFGLVIEQVYDSGTVYEPAILDITSEDLRKRFISVSNLP